MLERIIFSGKVIEVMRGMPQASPSGGG